MFKTETHIHTKNSSDCGWLFAEEMVKEYYEAGYSTIVITDHFCTENIAWDEKVKKSLVCYYKAKEISKKDNINVLMSTEMEFDKTKPNHYLLYGITEEFLIANPDINKMSIEEFSYIAKENGLFVVQAHTHRNKRCYPTPQFIDAIEIYNGNPRHSDYSDKSLKVAEDNNLYKIAGSDAHRKEDIARSGIITDIEIKSIDDLIVAIKERNIKIIYHEEI